MKYFGYTASRTILFVIVTILFSATAFAQTVKQEKIENSINSILKSSKYEYKKLTESAWLVMFDDENILVGADGDFFIAGVVVARKAEFRVTAESMSAMLKLAHSIDFVKIGIDSEEDLFVRRERQGKTMEKQEFNDYISIVSAAAKEVRTGIQPYLVKK